MRFDLLIQGGEVVDPGGEQMGRLDVAIQGNRIAAVDRNIPTESAARVIDAAGQIVTPGLVDLHTHVYHNVTYWGIHADPVAARSGVTTWLDVGSAGGYNLPGFREWIAEPSTARIFALLNISSIGLTAPTWELTNLDYCDVDLCTKMIERILRPGAGDQSPHRSQHDGGHRHRAAAPRPGSSRPSAATAHGPHRRRTAQPRRGARSHAPRRCADPLLHRPRHAHHRRHGQAARNGAAGVGCAASSSTSATARARSRSRRPRPCWPRAFRPDVISSDIHQLSIHGPLYDLPTCLSKFLALGMSLEEVIRAATIRPAEVMGWRTRSAHCVSGALADVALFRIEEGDFAFYDVHMNKRMGKQLLRNTLTIVDGQEMARAPRRSDRTVDRTERSATDADRVGPHAGCAGGQVRLQLLIRKTILVTSQYVRGSGCPCPGSANARVYRYHEVLRSTRTNK